MKVYIKCTKRFHFNWLVIAVLPSIPDQLLCIDKKLEVEYENEFQHEITQRTIRIEIELRVLTAKATVKWVFYCDRCQSTTNHERWQRPKNSSPFFFFHFVLITFYIGLGRKESYWMLAMWLAIGRSNVMRNAQSDKWKISATIYINTFPNADEYSIWLWLVKPISVWWIVKFNGKCNGTHAFLQSLPKKHTMIW